MQAQATPVQSCFDNRHIMPLPKSELHFLEALMKVVTEPWNSKVGATRFETRIFSNAVRAKMYSGARSDGARWSFSLFGPKLCAETFYERSHMTRTEELALAEYQVELQPFMLFRQECVCSCGATRFHTGACLPTNLASLLTSLASKEKNNEGELRDLFFQTVCESLFKMDNSQR